MLHLRFETRGSGPLLRAPLLEGLLARASAPARVADWRAEAFRSIAASPREPVPAVAAAALYAAAGEVRAVWACVATAVHLVAGMTHVTMPHDGRLELDGGEAAALAADFNRVFVGAGVRMVVGRAAALLCVFDRTWEVTTHDPAEAAGSDVFDFQPLGADAPALRRLMSEMEMWLFDHAVNRERTALGRRPITGLWLWGGGAALTALPRSSGWTAGRDPLFASFRVVTEYPAEAGAGVVVCAARPGSGEWADAEQRWLRPAMERLKSGRIDKIELSAGDRRFNVGGGLHWKFWRRPQPWWQSFEIVDGET